MKQEPFIVGVGGTTRTGSSSEMILSCVLAEAESQGAKTRLFGGRELADLPHYAPENPERTDAQLDLLEAVRSSDGLVFASPAYHGGVSGLVKNSIDLLEDLRNDDDGYLSGRAVGTVVTAAGWQACGVTLQALRGIVHALRGWPTPLGIAVNTLEQKPFDESGELADLNLRNSCALQATQILQIAKT